MRVSRERAAENRERILDTAACLFRENGFDRVGIDVIMKGAGLTHGGFYGHFTCKDDLAAEATIRALDRGGEKHSRHTTLRAWCARISPSSIAQIARTAAPWRRSGPSWRDKVKDFGVF